MKRVFAFVFARGGSKGLPRKNLLEIEGLSLTRRAIRVAKQIAEVEKVFLSTDCQEIQREGEQEEVEVIVRPENWQPITHRVGRMEACNRLCRRKVWKF